MKPIPKIYTETIAVRIYDIVSKDITRSIEIALGRPIQDVETVNGFDWRCPVRVTDGEFVDIENACGVDALQAIELASTKLALSQAKKAVKDADSLLLFGEAIQYRDKTA